jgi:hypothetical protein
VRGKVGAPTLCSVRIGAEIMGSSLRLATIRSPSATWATKCSTSGSTR